MASDRLVWFLLVDGAGEAFKGTTASKVKVRSDGDVDDVRRAVHGVYPKVLAEFDAGQLLVYGNKAAFEANSADSPTVLRSSSPLDGLGNDEDNALCVVVPEQNDKSTPPVHPSEERKRRFDELNRILSQAEIEASNETNKKMKQSSNFSSIKWETVAPLFVSSMATYEQEEKSIPDDILKELQAYSARAFKCFELASCSEATLNIFIAPVLVQVCALFDGDIKIFAEETLKGKYVKANGRFEFVLKSGLKSIFIVEAKKDDFEQGAAQELVGAEVAAELGSLDVVYGIVTNFKEWVFYKSSNDKIERDVSLMFHPEDARSMETTLAKVTAKIYAMLSE